MEYDHNLAHANLLLAETTPLLSALANGAAERASTRRVPPASASTLAVQLPDGGTMA